MDPRRALRSFSLATSLVLACAPTVAPRATTSLGSPPTGAPGSPVASAVITTYEDPILGITFLAPAGLVVTRAEPGAEGQTTQAIFNTYSNPNGVDLSRELSITASIVRRGTNEDLRAFAARGFPGSYTVSPLAGRNGIVLEGDFQSGPRKFVLIERGPDHVLLISAFPRNSSRIAIFDQLLATLVVR